MIAIIDYGVGNLFSLKSSLKYLNVPGIVTADEALINSSSKIILPGVGAFGDAIKRLESIGLIPAILNNVKQGKPLLGICLGMQLLFERGMEFGTHKGLGLLQGEVVPLDANMGLKIPHMGWNSLDIRQYHPLLKYVKQGDYVYFVHSYHASKCSNSLVATANYGIDVSAVVANKNVMGTQFHPEKSGSIGLKILKAFCELGA
ncbi:MAG: imidazole glycerol phosphate synthase subunit HisH [Christensenellaceae bacterium]|nr:imidazole glycerol phosphate synthase subunit HisH [Christensenellaceae bacterium]